MSYIFLIFKDRGMESLLFSQNENHVSYFLPMLPLICTYGVKDSPGGKKKVASLKTFLLVGPGPLQGRQVMALAPWEPCWWLSLVPPTSLASFSSWGGGGWAGGDAPSSFLTHKAKYLTGVSTSAPDASLPHSPHPQTLAHHIAAPLAASRLPRILTIWQSR